ncbi:MAG: hypothetical protein AAFN92_02820 [Bacteroidota bacterium]
MHEDHPQLPHEDYPWFWLHRNLGRPPRWTFPNQLAGNELWCPRLTFDNFDSLWPILAKGDTTFINREYRERTALYEQLFSQFAYAAYSGKHGVVDYLIVSTPGENTDYRASDGWRADGRLRSEQATQLCGVLHLYELSHERYDGRMPNPFVGLQLTPAVRGTGVVDRAMELLERFTRESYPEITGLTAMIERENLRSQRFFARRGYVKSGAYGASGKEIFLVKDISGPEGRLASPGDAFPGLQYSPISQYKN